MHFVFRLIIYSDSGQRLICVVPLKVHICTALNFTYWRRQQTGCKLSVTHRNLIAVWLISCTTSFIGLMSQTESCTSWVHWCTDASMTKLLSTWWTTARQSLTFSDSICIRPAITNFSCHVIIAALMAAGRFLLPARLSGTHCSMTYWIRNALLTLLDSYWRRSYSRSISVYSILEILLH